MPGAVIMRRQSESPAKAVSACAAICSRKRPSVRYCSSIRRNIEIAGLSVVAEKANFTASVGSIDGPYALAGSATVNGAPLKLDLGVGARTSDGMVTNLALEAGGGKLTFKGTLSELGPNASLAGVASVSAESLTGFIATLISLAGQPVPALPPLLASKFSFDGGVELSQSRIAAHDFKLALAGDSGSGKIIRHST